MNVIYAYKKVDENRIVYVGQSVNLESRHAQHVKYDPYNPNTREYNYPLSRGIRKYGESAYELVILEDNIPKDQLDKREIYWIKYYDTYYHGYNQTTGGTYPTRPIYDENMIDLVISMLKDPNNSYQDIADKTKLSMTHIYNINIGARRRRDNEVYPIRPNNIKGTRGAKLSPEENQEVHALLKNSPLTMQSIAEQYNCDAATIRRINMGKTKMYRLVGYEYPIRINR